MRFAIYLTLGVALTAFAGLVVTSFQHPPVEVVQVGYRGTGMQQVFNPATREAQRAANTVPAPQDKVDPGEPSSKVYTNVKVLGNVGSDELVRLMAAITEWVAPQQGCNYCHNPDNLADDSLYTKVVARRMLEMTRHINADWKAHVGNTGVTCFTCHRGNPVPNYVWFTDPGTAQTQGFAQAYIGKNHPGPLVGLTALPADPLTSLFDENGDIRVVSTTPLPGADKSGIKDAEKTYALMMHISQSLGVNCTFCHNAQAFTSWETSTPQRVTAWHGIRMVRDLNEKYLDPLASTFPKNRLGTLGDGPKISCMTCHQGISKPLFGANMVKDYPELGTTK
jgi:photosynthetic reaction center cytochrome c subunit